MLRRIITLRFKEYIIFRWELISTFLSSLITVFFISIFWKIVTKYTFFKFEDAILFECYRSFTMFIVYTFFYCFRHLNYVVRSGRLTLFLTYPIHPLAFLLYNIEIRIGALINSLLFLLIYSKFSLKILLGFLICILAAFTFLSLLFLFSVLSLRGESDISDLVDDVCRRMGSYPTHLYEGIAFIISNFIFPAFALGTYSFLISKGIFQDLVRYFTLYSLLVSPSLFVLSVIIFNRFLKEYMAYGG